MLRIRKDLCLGCGVCADSCLRQAISIISGQAQIDQSRCNQCRLCLDVCPQRAIIELTLVSEAELATMIGSLRQKADDLVRHIERLRQQQNIQSQN